MDSVLRSISAGELIRKTSTLSSLARFFLRRAGGLREECTAESFFEAGSVMDMVNYITPL